MKNYLIAEIAEIQKKQHYKHVALFDQSGNPIVKFNTNAIDPGKRLTEILTRLNSDALPDGLYIFKGKNSPSKNVYTDDYVILKGKATTEPMPPVLSQTSFSPDVLSYESALKMQVENERLKLENANLLQKIEQLENELTEQENENSLLSEQETPNLLESGKAFLSEIVSIAAPLLDKHFELKEKQLSLQALQFQQKYNTRRPSPEQAPRAREDRHAEIVNIESWINSYQEDPENYEILATLYNNAKSKNDFFQTLERENIDLFNQYKNNLPQ
jgi:hypothetical protein